MSHPNHLPPPPAGIATLTDPDLLRRYVAESDQRAFAELVKRHSGWVISTAQRRCGLAELAQECAQNVFLALARKAPGLQALAGLAPWLHRAAVLETAALLRRESRYRNAMKRHCDESALHETGDAAAEAWRAVREQVDEALNSLSGTDRDLLIMHHVEGRTFQEIGKNLGATEAAAQRRGHRALEKLTARLQRGGVAVPVSLLGVAMGSGMRAEAANAQSQAASVLQAVTAGGAAAAPAFALPAWAASPAMLAAVGLLSAGASWWWSAESLTAPPGQGTGLSTLVVPGAVPGTSSKEVSEKAPAAATPESRLAFLRQALEKLRQPPAADGPTKLGLHLRKYMMGLTLEELTPVGELLSGVPGYDGEFPDILGAFSTRLARINPRLALELLASGKDKGLGKDPGIRFSRTVMMDVLSRGVALPEVLRICEINKELQEKLVRVWATHQPLAAMEYAEQRLAASPGQFDRSAYLTAWLFREPVDAVRWLDVNAEAKPEIYRRANGLFGTLGRWAVQQMPSREAVALTLGLRDPVVRNDFVSGMFSAYSREQPEVLAGLAPLLQLEADAKPLSVSRFLTAWRRKDENAASAWVTGLPDGDLKTAARHSLEQPLPPKP